MLQQQWTQTAGQLSTSQIWKKIRSFLQDTPAEIMLGCINDDLIGFFNSVPQERLVQAVSDVVQQWRQTHVGDAISVDIQQQGHVVATTFAGSYKKQAAHIKTIRIDDIFPIVQKPLLDHTLFYCPQPSVASNPGSRDWESYRSYYFKSCRNHGRTQLARNVFPNFKCSHFSQFDYSVRWQSFCFVWCFPSQQYRTAPFFSFGLLRSTSGTGESWRWPFFRVQCKPGHPHFWIHYSSTTANSWFRFSRKPATSVIRTSESEPFSCTILISSDTSGTSLGKTGPSIW